MNDDLHVRCNSIRFGADMGRCRNSFIRKIAEELVGGNIERVRPMSVIIFEGVDVPENCTRVAFSMGHWDSSRTRSRAREQEEHCTFWKLLLAARARIQHLGIRASGKSKIKNRKPFPRIIFADGNA